MKGMSWSFLLILIPTICYAATAVVYSVKGNWPLVFAYSGYTWANIGFLWLDILMRKAPVAGT